MSEETTEPIGDAGASDDVVVTPHDEPSEIDLLTAEKNQ